jgi:hypothetical protein
MGVLADSAVTEPSLHFRSGVIAGDYAAIAVASREVR